MAHVGTDLFDFGGGKYLVCVDQWSGYPLYRKLQLTTSSSVIRILSERFNLLGWPRSIRSHGGPQFRSEFSEFCAKYQIRHEVSSPYNPRANGLAELTVKTVKNMLKKCLEEGEDVERALYEWRNLPCEHGFSPSQLLFGRRQRMLLPQPDSAYEQVSFEKAAMAKNKHFDAQGVRYDRDKVSLPVLSVGQLVCVQDEKSGQWQALATVIEARPDGLSYIVDIGGREQLRSRHMLRPEQVPSPKNESERDGPIFESERDGPKVGVIPYPTPAMRRSRLLEKNSQGNRPGVLVTLCCYFRANPLPTEPDTAQHDNPPVLAGSGWYRTPNGGWAGAPVSSPSISQHSLPAIFAAAGGQVHGIQQLPFPGFPPVNYQPAGLSPCGMPGCRTSGSSYLL